MRLTDIRAFKPAIESLSNSSALTVSAQKARCDLRRLNSPHSSHTTCECFHSHIDGPATLFDNGGYKVAVYDSLMPLEEDYARTLLGEPTENEELVLILVPAIMVAPLFDRVREFFPIKQEAVLVSLARYRRKLVGYAEDGTPIFAGDAPEGGA